MRIRISAPNKDEYHTMRSCITSKPCQMCNQNVEDKEDEMGRACSTHDDEECLWNFCGKTRYLKEQIEGKAI
jgi:hypothetical protein